MMEKLKISLLLIVVLASSCADVVTKDDAPPPEPHPKPDPTTSAPNITTVSPNSTTFAPITTVAPNITTVDPNTTTVAPKTTTVPSNTTTTVAPITTTVVPNTTTVAPNTTTVAPNTTTVAPNTTTVAPNTTTVAPKPTTPAPSPKPVPDPTLGHWSVDYESSNRSCLGVDLAGQFEFLSQNRSMKMNLSPNATSSGTCSNLSDSLVLRWDNNSVEMDFRKLNTSKYELGEIKVVLNLTWPGEGELETEGGVTPRIYTLVHNYSEFPTPLSNSYKCAKVQTLNLTEENKNETIAYFHVSHVQLQAFQNTTGHTFDSAIDCDGSVVTDVVPIVVGCVLAALVVMVLVAYLIGRRRCQARGYLSMFADTKSESEYIPMKNISCFK